MFSNNKNTSIFIHRAFKMAFLAIFCLFSINPNIFAEKAIAAAPQELRDMIDQKSQELEVINTQIKETQKNLQSVQGQGQTLNQEIKKLDSNISQVNLGIQYSETMVDKLGLEINSLSYDIRSAEEDIIIKKEAVVKLIQQLQQSDNENFLVIFLKNRNLAESVFEAQGLADLHQGLLKAIDELQSSKNNLASKLEDTSTKQQQEQSENQNLKNKKLILDDVKKDKQSVLQQTKNQEKIYQSVISDLEKKQLAISQEINSLEENLRLSFDSSLLPRKRPSVLAYPLTNHNITQEYGATAFARRAYKSGFHNGIDFSAPIGTPILATEDGQVFATGNNGRVQYGKFIVIKHQNNLATLYAHLSKIIVGEGVLVKRGEIIGYSGNTGYSTGPHLHFTVYWAPSVTLKSFSGAGLVPLGVTINPADYL